MTPEEFDTDGWIDRVAAALAELAHAQGPYLEEYWQDNPREHVMVDGRDETPFSARRRAQPLFPGSLRQDLRQGSALRVLARGSRFHAPRPFVPLCDRAGGGRRPDRRRERFLDADSEFRRVDLCVGPDCRADGPGRGAVG